MRRLFLIFNDNSVKEFTVYASIVVSRLPDTFRHHTQDAVECVFVTRLFLESVIEVVDALNNLVVHVAENLERYCVLEVLADD